MSIRPAELHFNDADGHGASIYRGDDWSHTLTCYSDEDKTVPLDLSTATIDAQIRRSAKSNASIVATFTTAVGGVDNNVLTLSLARAVTETLVPARYGWDLQIEIGGDRKTRARGEAVVVGDYTR